MSRTPAPSPVPLSTKEQLRLVIERGAVKRRSDGLHIVDSEGGDLAWLVDFRSILLTPLFLKLAADVFWETFNHAYPFQVGGLETTALPLIASIVLRGSERGMPVNGFYVRKSRKHYGLQKTVEGTLTSDPIILIDDVLNSGASFARLIRVLADEGRSVSDVFAFIRYRNHAYEFGEGVTLTTLFTPQDIGLAYQEKKKQMPRPDAFSILWRVPGANPNFFYRIPKSAPALDADKVYMGGDDGVMHARYQKSGAVAWAFKIRGAGDRGKKIFSSPAVHGDTVFFGAYDGTFYALDARTGEERWAYADADWVGSSPTIASGLGLVFVGLEYGLLHKQGGIAALDIATGMKRWEFIEMPSLTHGSPAYSEKLNAVAIGSNDGVLYCFRALDGVLLWQFRTGGEIKAAPIFDEERGLVIFGSFDGKVYALDRKDGAIVFAYETGAGIYSTPCIWKGRVLVSSLDKSIYCLNLDSFALEWSFQTAGRIFSSPEIVTDLLYVGANDGRLYELDPSTGRHTAFFQATERITNKIAYNPGTKHFFVPTYANELYCLERKSGLGDKVGWKK